jgi:hypothetical protein
MVVQKRFMDLINKEALTINMIAENYHFPVRKLAEKC